MKKPTTEIPAEKIDELLAFLPIFDDPTYKPIQEWIGGFFPYPVYAEPVKAFFELLEDPFWCDREYARKVTADMLADEKRIAQADISIIRSMLTYCKRGEKFCSGHRGAMVREGNLAALLKRLAALRGHQSRPHSP